MKEYLERIGKALGGKPKPGGGWMCHCPAHDDTNPSLSVDPGENGMPVVKCWAGCSQQEVIAALRNRGLWPEQQRTGDHAGTATGKRSKEKKRVARDPEAAATEAGRRWQAAGPANREHPYLAGKGLDGRELRREGNLLLVPMYNEEGVVRSLQTISAEGRKLFLKGGAVTGLYCPIGDLRESGKPVCVVEGWATGAAIHAAGGYPVAVAFSAGNLAQVAGCIRAQLPGAGSFSVPTMIVPWRKPTTRVSRRPPLPPNPSAGCLPFPAWAKRPTSGICGTSRGRRQSAGRLQPRNRLMAPWSAWRTKPTPGETRPP